MLTQDQKERIIEMMNDGKIVQEVLLHFPDTHPKEIQNFMQDTVNAALRNKSAEKTWTQEDIEWVTKAMEKGVAGSVIVAHFKHKFTAPQVGERMNIIYSILNPKKPELAFEVKHLEKDEEGMDGHELMFTRLCKQYNALGEQLKAVGGCLNNIPVEELEDIIRDVFNLGNIFETEEEVTQCVQNVAAIIFAKYRLSPIVKVIATAHTCSDECNHAQE